MKTKRGWIAVIGLMSLCLSTVSQAEPVSSQDMENQIQMLQKRIEMLESNQDKGSADQAASEKKTPAKASAPGAFVIPGTETEIQFGGYAKVDMIWSDVSMGDNSDLNQYFGAFAIPLSNEPHKKDQFSLTARQSRLSLGSTSQTSYGKLRTYIEGDFYGTGGTQDVTNAYTFRLRHAYAQFGNVMAGQNWSTIMNPAAIPETVDFGGPTGQLFVRQAQIRWTQPFSWGDMQFAVENPQTKALKVAGTTSSYDADRFPDFIVKASLKKPWGSLSLGGLAREMRRGKDAGVDEDKVWGAAASVSGVIPTMGKDDVRFQLNYGTAIGRYMWCQFADVVDKGANDEIDTYDQLGGFVAYRHFWKEGLRSSIMYGFGMADNDALAPKDKANKEMQTFHVNLMWNPVPKVALGVEYIYGSREVENGNDGSLNRIQFGAQYNFF